MQPLKSVFHGEKTVNFICCQWSTGICLTSVIYCSLQNTVFSMKTFSPFNFMLASWMSSPLPLGAQQLATQQIVQITDVTRCCHDASSLTVHGALRAMQLSVLPIIRSVLLQNSGCLLHLRLWGIWRKLLCLFCRLRKGSSPAKCISAQQPTER